jgi:hypothetical protein
MTTMGSGRGTEFAVDSNKPMILGWAQERSDPV